MVKVKRYLMHCDYCGKRVIVKGSSGLSSLKEISQAPIPRGHIHLELDENKVKLKEVAKKEIAEREAAEKDGVEFKKKFDPMKVLPRRKLLKCPCCGRGLVLRKDSTILPEIEEEKSVEEEDYGPGRKTSTPGPEVSGGSAGRTPN